MAKDEYSASINHRLEILSDFYNVDYEHKRIDVHLYYEDINDALDLSLLHNKTPQFKNEVLEKISKVVNDFPITFKANITISSDNLRGYQVDDLLRSLRHSLELFHYSSDANFKKRFLVAMAMLSIGLFFLFLLVMFDQFSLDSMVANAFTSVGEIISWIFVWEGVTLIVVAPNLYYGVDTKLIKRIHQIGFIHQNNTVYISAREIAAKYVKDSVHFQIFSTLFLASAVGFISLSIPCYIRNVMDAQAGVFGSGYQLALFMVFLTLYYLIQFATGILSLLSYTRQRKRFLHAVNVMSFLMVFFNLSGIILMSVYIGLKCVSATLIIPFIFTLIFTITYLVGYFLSKKKS